MKPHNFILICCHSFFTSPLNTLIKYFFDFIVPVLFFFVTHSSFPFLFKLTPKTVNTPYQPSYSPIISKTDLLPLPNMLNFCIFFPYINIFFSIFLVYTQINPLLYSPKFIYAIAFGISSITIARYDFLS